MTPLALLLRFSLRQVCFTPLWLYFEEALSMLSVRIDPPVSGFLLSRGRLLRAFVLCAAAMVAAGLGVAWLPSSLLEGNVCGVPLHGGTYRRRIGLCYAPDMRELPAVSALLAAFAEAEPAAG